MKCQRCGSSSTLVQSENEVDGTLRRQRECGDCHERFATVEQVQRAIVMVLKRDGRREPFQREKLLAGLRVCARKRPLPAGAIEAIADDIEHRLLAAARSEVPSRVIGEMAITRLKQLDPISYIRFASAYRQFVSLDDMLHELAQIAFDPSPPAEQPRLFEDEFDRLLAAQGASERVPTPIASARSATIR
ncbi:MAG: transcriptional repressor NrdR [Dehalococcoidia bacterium]|nr:transcriptional repressor NrdR [Dehalococcoidia bacterium]